MRPRLSGILTAFLSTFLVLFCVSPVFPVVKPTVVVVGFDITVPGLQYEETLPAALTDLMINALINSNRFRVFERRKLEALLTEQGFQHYSGLVDPSTAVQLGRMLGAHYVMTGSITGISHRGGGGVRMGPVAFGESATLVTLTVRIVDVATGEILYSEVKQKKAKGSTVGLAIGPVDFYSRTSQDIITAVNAACEEIVATFIERMDQGVGELAQLPLQGYVVQTRGNTVYLNLGKDSGIVVGDVVRIYHPGEAIVDPKTGEVLDQELIFVAEARVSRVKDRVSEALVLRRTGTVSPEDVVEVVGRETGEPVPQREESAISVSIETEAPPDTREEPSSFPEETAPPKTQEAESPEEPLPEETTFEGKTVQYYRQFYPKGGGLKVEYTYYLANGKMVEHGVFTKYYDNGQIMIQGTYLDGKKEGVWKEYLRNGIPKTEGTYKNGVREGLWITYYPGGKKHFEGMYRNGEKDGEWIEYAGDGSIFARIVYKNGKVVSKKMEE
jgi:curli biogenesis system outer membrane secretion channel CsgG